MSEGETFSLIKGTTITVEFTNTNTASNPTFAVGGTNAKSINYNGTVLTTGSTVSYAGATNQLLTYVYDGTDWCFIAKSRDNNTTYSAITEANAKAGTSTTAGTITPAILSKAAKGFVTATSGATPTQELTPGIHYVFGTCTSLTVTFGTAVSGVVNEYSFEFDSGSTATTITLPTTNVVWQDTPSCSANCHYEINVKYDATTSKYYGLWAEWPES